MEKHTNGTKWWMQWTALAGELFGFRCPQEWATSQQPSWREANRLRIQSSYVLVPYSDFQGQSEAELSSGWQEAH